MIEATYAHANRIRGVRPPDLAVGDLRVPRGLRSAVCRRGVDPGVCAPRGHPDAGRAGVEE